MTRAAPSRRVYVVEALRHGRWHRIAQTAREDIAARTVEQLEARGFRMRYRGVRELTGADGQPLTDAEVSV